MNPFVAMSPLIIYTPLNLLYALQSRIYLEEDY